MVKYVTTTQLAEAIGIVSSIPFPAVGDSPVNEAVGTGDDSNKLFYLDNKNILADSYILYANNVAMTEVTHYTLDKTTGAITLSSAGVTTLTTNDLTAKYSYMNNGMSDAFLAEVIGRAETELDNITNTVFVDGTATNPTYPNEIEFQQSEGLFMDRIITHKKPLKDITSTLSADINSSVGTIAVATGDGASFPSTGYIIIESEVITYTGVSTDNLTGCTRGVLGSTAVAHVETKIVHSTVFLRSDTTEGTAVTWTVQPWDTAMFANIDGLIYKYRDADPHPLTRSGIANRVQIIYLYGHDTIPNDIVRLSIILAKRQLMQDTISKSMIAGRNEFRPEMMNADMEEMKMIVGEYIIIPLGNT